MKTLAFFLATILLTVRAAGAAILPPGFTESQVGSNVGASPTAMEIAPDGRIFVCLQGGQLRVIKNGVLLPTPFVTSRSIRSANAACSASLSIRISP